MPARFGDRVRIVSTPATVDAGVAGLVGSVFGETKPSASGVAVIGGAADDFALNVYFDERKESRWFTLELVEFLNLDAGTTFRLDGVPKKWVRQETGEWQEKDVPLSPWQRFLARFRRHD
jgi:hypothetical protein